MAVHWWRMIREKEGKGRRATHRTHFWINMVGATTTAVALFVIIVAKFTEGAWITVVIVPALVAMFSAIRRHYDHVTHELYPPEKLQTWKVRPLCGSRNGRQGRRRGGPAQ